MSSRAGSTNSEDVKYVGCSTTWPLGVVCVGARDIAPHSTKFKLWFAGKYEIPFLVSSQTRPNTSISSRPGHNANHLQAGRTGSHTAAQSKCHLFSVTLAAQSAFSAVPPSSLHHQIHDLSAVPTVTAGTVMMRTAKSCRMNLPCTTNL
jgi:hypothetical protein